MVSAGPVPALELPEEPVEEHPRGLALVDPGVRDRRTHGVPQVLEMQEQAQEIVLRRDGPRGAGGQRRGGRGGGAHAARLEAAQVALERGGGEAQEGRGLRDERRARDLALRGGDDREDALGGAAPLLGGGRRGGGQERPAGERHGRERGFLHLLVGRQAALEEEEVGIDLRVAGERQEAHLDVRP